MTRATRGLLLTLSAASLLSALGVVQAKYESRQLFVAVQEARAERDRLDTEWGRLQIELGTWGAHARVEQAARDQLDMRLPRPDEIIVVSD